jgi:hypothetical protein
MEEVCCGYQSTCLFQAFQVAGISAAYCGHDHNNNYYGSLGGVRLGYGQKTGYGSYGPAKGMKHGARVILLRQGEQPADSETWIRYGDGTKEVQAPYAKTPWFLSWFDRTPSAQQVCKLE